MSVPRVRPLLRLVATKTGHVHLAVGNWAEIATIADLDRFRFGWRDGIPVGPLCDHPAAAHAQPIAQDAAARRRQCEWCATIAEDLLEDLDRAHDYEAMRRGHYGYADRCCIGCGVAMLDAWTAGECDGHLLPPDAAALVPTLVGWLAGGGFRFPLSYDAETIR